MGSNNAGRPPKFESADEMQKIIDVYFADCEGKPFLGDDGSPVLDKWGSPIMIGAHPPTVTGLALALGFNSRQTLLNYKAKREFMDTITRAKMRVEEYCERRLFDRDGQRGAEFNLKFNFKWAQEKEEDDDDAGGIIEIPAVMVPEEKGEEVNGATDTEEK